MHTRQEQLAAFERLLDIMDILRVQCPWDKKQTFESLRENTIEEAFELANAISKKDMTEISKEVGDVLLHVVFYAKMGSETNDFDITDVCNKLCDKLIFRHPHVFKGENANGEQVGNLRPEEVSQLWEQVKLKEKGGNKTVLSGIPDSLPSLVKAYRIQDKVANVGFDWEKKEDVWKKVKEEIGEFEAELTNEGVKELTDEGVKELTNERATEEFGDLLFSLINAARLYKIRPDSALEQTNIKFIKRFNYVEQRAKELGKSLQEMTLDEMEALWQEAKRV